MWRQIQPEILGSKRKRCFTGLDIIFFAILQAARRQSALEKGQADSHAAGGTGGEAEAAECRSAGGCAHYPVGEKSRRQRSGMVSKREKGRAQSVKEAEQKRAGQGQICSGKDHIPHSREAVGT